MNLKRFWRELWREQRVLIAGGLAFMGLLLILAVVSLLDSEQILGINRWIKPMKFSVSITIYLWTLAVFLYFLPGYEKSSRAIGWGAALVMAGEIVLIVMQAARGATSHFNNRTPFDSAVFSFMGLLILVNTVLLVYLTYLYFRARPDLPEAVVWGMRLGLIIFLLASFEGAYMAQGAGHAVGVKDGGAGLPFVNWSTEGGDLRVAHFVGMHAFQAVPLFALMLIGLKRRFLAIRATALTVAFAILYCAAFTLVFMQALKGRPLLGREIIVTRQAADEGK
jgi:hypothetical protein